MDTGFLPAGCKVMISPIIPLSPHPSWSLEASSSPAPRQAAEEPEGRWGECLCFGSVPKLYFHWRASDEIWDEAEDLGNLLQVWVWMVVLAGTPSSCPAVQRFIPIMILMIKEDDAASAQNFPGQLETPAVFSLMAVQFEPVVGSQWCKCERHKTTTNDVVTLVQNNTLNTHDTVSWFLVILYLFLVTKLISTTNMNLHFIHLLWPIPFTLFTLNSSSDTQTDPELFCQSHYLYYDFLVRWHSNYRSP